MTRPRALLYVQHLLGTGHLVRTAAIARGLAAAGWEVHVASGGKPAPQVQFGAATLYQLPPIHAADTSFKILHDANGQPIDDALRRARTDMLLDLFVGARPDAVVIETFPFGRRQMEFELLPLLKAAKRSRHRPIVACSVRDILQMAKNRARLEASAASVETYFDRVLVHGDPRFVAFDETFPLAPRIADKIVYTGYVTNDDAAAARNGARTDEVIVSAGGGPVGLSLLQTALAARPLSARKPGVWRLLVAGDLAMKIPALRRGAPAGIVIEENRADFTALLRVGKVSVSQAGYNTMMDILQAGIAAVLVPFAAGHETEQTLRALRLTSRGRAEMIAETDLTPALLAAAIDRAAMTAVPDLALDMNGVANTVAALRTAIDARAST